MELQPEMTGEVQAADSRAKRRYTTLAMLTSGQLAADCLAISVETRNPLSIALGTVAAVGFVWFGGQAFDQFFVYDTTALSAELPETEQRP